MHPSPILPVAFDPFSADPTSESYIPELDLDALESEPSTPKWKQLFNHTRGRSTAARAGAAHGAAAQSAQHQVEERELVEVQTSLEDCVDRR
uniref:Uncharacterized protein n=1 Tax=Mycena chlorophos TaxID=658473 RepID=A0ABQ0L5Q0_MYCCL|nr:predicted protein [Mycena chlorophos]